MSTRILTACLLGLVLFGCRRADDQRTEAITADQVRQARETMHPAVVEQIDSGNVAFRERRYPDALRYYHEAARLDADAAAAWFGIYMAEQALGNADAADEALRRARAAAPRASLVEPDAAEPAPPVQAIPAAPTEPAAAPDTGQAP